MLKSKVLLSLVVFFSSTLLFSQQTITGKVLDEENKPIEGASVYFDGSSIGTITNKSGKFTIKTRQNLHSILIVRYLGYQSLMITIDSEEKILKLGNLKMTESIESLNDVVVENDPWSREKKLKYFRRWFLGGNHQEKECRIVNEDAIQLTFKPSTQQLTAKSDEVLIIENKSLNYSISYQLASFQLLFSKPNVKTPFNNIVYYAEGAYYSGTSFFQNLEEEKGRHRRERKRTYKGSVLHFMRSLAAKELTKNKFEIYYENFKVKPYKYLIVNPQENRTTITVEKEKLIILYKGDEQSQLFVTKVPTIFFIDAYGNFYPPHLLTFGSAMGSQKVSEMLPLDYEP